MHYLSSAYSRATWRSLRARRHKNVKNKSGGTTTILISRYGHFYGSIKKEWRGDAISESLKRGRPKKRHRASGLRPENHRIPSVGTGRTRFSPPLPPVARSLWRWQGWACEWWRCQLGGSRPAPSHWVWCWRGGARVFPRPQPSCSGGKGWSLGIFALPCWRRGFFLRFDFQKRMRRGSRETGGAGVREAPADPEQAGADAWDKARYLQRKRDEHLLKFVSVWGEILVSELRATEKLGARLPGGALLNQPRSDLALIWGC